MGRVFALLAALAVVISVDASGLKNKKAKRQPRFSHDATPIDELVRKEDDPNYDEWKKRQAQEEAQRQASAEKVIQERFEREKMQEKARLEHIRMREERKVAEQKRLNEQWQAYLEHKKAKKALRAQQEKARREYVEYRAKSRSGRMPATVNSPKYPGQKEK